MQRIKLILGSIFFLALLLFVQRGYGQKIASDPRGLDVVYLQDSSIFRGEIVHYAIGEELKLKTRNGVIISIPGNLIGKIVQEKEHSKKKSTESFIVDQGHFFNSIRITTLNGYFSDGFITGLGIENSFGYKWNHWLQTAIGVGFDNYLIGNTLSVIPFYGEIRGQMTNRNFAPTYGVKVGYAIGTKDEDININRANGGMMYEVSMGFVKHKRPRFSWHFDLGYRFQEYDLRRDIGFETFEEYDILFQRLMVRFGFTF